MTPAELRATMAALGLTPTKLAREVGYGRAQVHRWLNGEVAVPVLLERYLALVAERREMAERLAR